MKIQHVEWRSDDNLYRHSIDIVSIAKRQILFTSTCGTLALCTLKEVDNGTVKYIIKYGNSLIANSALDNDGVLLRIKKWLADDILKGEFTRIEFTDIFMELDKKTLSFTIN